MRIQLRKNERLETYFIESLQQIPLFYEEFAQSIELAMYECMDYQFYQGFYIPICWVVPNMLRETEPWLLIKERMNGEDSDIQDVLIRRESLSKLMKPNLLDIDGGDDLWSLFIETIEILPTVMIKFNHSGKERVLLSEENLTRAIDQLEIQYTPKNLGPLLEECHNKENMVRSEQLIPETLLFTHIPYDYDTCMLRCVDEELEEPKRIPMQKKKTNNRKAKMIIKWMRGELEQDTNLLDQRIKMLLPDEKSNSSITEMDFDYQDI